MTTNKREQFIQSSISLIGKIRHEQEETSKIINLFSITNDNYNKNIYIKWETFDGKKLYEPIKLDDKGSIVWIVEKKPDHIAFISIYPEGAEIRLHGHVDFVETVTLLKGKVLITLKDKDEKFEVNLKPNTKEIIEENIIHKLKIQQNNTIIYGEWLRGEQINELHNYIRI